MVRVTATHNNIKPKKSEEIDVESFDDLILQIEKVFNVEYKTIVFMKPPLKDETSFKSKIKEGLQILFKATVRVEKSEEQIIKEKEMKRIQEEKMIEAENKILMELKMNPHEKILKELKAKGIPERGFSHLTEEGLIDNMDTDHFTCALHLLRICPELKRYSQSYEVQPKNPDGLLIEELGKTFREIEEEPDKIPDPLDWATSFIAYCADDIEYPFPTYDFNYIIPKIFTTIEYAVKTDLERREPNANPSNKGPMTMKFGMDCSVIKKKLTPLDDDDFQVGVEQEKEEHFYVMECDLSREEFSSYEAGVIERFKKRNVWESFYAFDLEYEQTILSINKPLKYLFVHVNRIGYPPAKDESQQIVLLNNKKSTHKVRLKNVIDFSSLCSSSLTDKLETGKFERHQLFSKFTEEDEYTDYLKELEGQGINIGEYSTNEKAYMFFDNKKLFKYDIFHEFYFDQQLKASKETGEYKIAGVIFHKGDYYHHPVETHNMEEHGHTPDQCRGEFMVIVYRRGADWLKFHGGNVEIVTIDEVLHEKHWGGGEWTPALILYRAIFMKNIEIQVPQ